MSGLESLYQELILDHARRRVGHGVLDDAAAAPGHEQRSATSHQRNPICGDEIGLRVRLEPSADGDVVAALVWDGLGCSISQASASMLTELTVGVPVAQVDRLLAGFREVMRSKGALGLDEEEFGDAAALSGVSRYTARVKCAMLAWVALEDAAHRAQAT